MSNGALVILLLAAAVAGLANWGEWSAVFWGALCGLFVLGVDLALHMWWTR